MPNLGSLVVSLLGDTKQFERSMTATQKKVMAIGKSLSDMGKKMTMFVTLPIAGIGTAALISAGKMEKHRIAFETMLGSADKAKDLLKDIEKFSAATPFQLPNLVEGTKRLIAFGTESKDVIDKMRMLGNAAQGDQEILDRLTLAYGKLQAKGRATLEELNMFTEAGVPILQALADTLEVTTEELFDMISQGKVSFDDVDKALRSLTTGSGQFAGMIEKQSKSLLGLFSTVKDNLGMLARSFAEILLPQIKNFLDRTLAVVQKIGEMDDKTKKLILAVAGLAAGLGPVLFISGKLVGSITALSAALKLLIPKLVTLGAAAGPIFLVAAALTALGVIIYKNVQANKDLAEAYEALRKPMKDVTDLQRLEALAFIQAADAKKLHRKEIELEGAIRSVMQHGSQEYIDTLKEEIETLGKGITARQNTITWLNKEIEAKEKSGEAIDKLIPKTDDEADSLTDLGKEIITTSDAWTRWAETTRSRTDGAIAGKEITDELTESTFDLFHATQIYNAEIKSSVELALEAAEATNGIISKYDELNNKYDEWEEKNRQAINNVFNFTSTMMSGIDSIMSQSFENRQIELDNWYRGEELTKNEAYENEKARIENTITDEEEKTAALLQAEQDYNDEITALGEEMDKKQRKMARDQAKTEKTFSLFQAIINTAAAIVSGLNTKPFVPAGLAMGALAGILGAAQIAAIRAQPLPALATGADFITQGPQLVMVGDNPGGREQVRVTPLSSPNINGPGREIIIHNNLYLDGNQVLDFISKAAEDGRLPIHENAIVRG